jgi:hypothetical protein
MAGPVVTAEEDNSQLKGMLGWLLRVGSLTCSVQMRNPVMNIPPPFESKAEDIVSRYSSSTCPVCSNTDKEGPWDMDLCKARQTSFNTGHWGKRSFSSAMNGPLGFVA